MTGRPLEGQTALVTGAGSGIGRAIAERLASEGAAIAIVDLDGAAASSTATTLSEAGAKATVHEADVSLSADVARVVEEVRGQLGRVSILVNNAGISRGGRVQDIPEAEWDLVVAVNLRGTYLFCKYVVPLMLDAGYGRIINISSGTGVRVGPGTSPYSASKAGIIALTKSVAGELATRNITANAVAPGLTDTPMTRGTFGDGEALQALASSGRIANPMRVVVQPVDIAAAVAFFASPESRYITGQTLHVNAGSYMP